MTTSYDSIHKLGLRGGRLPDQEECASGLMPLQQSQHLRSAIGIRSIVECQRENRLRCDDMTQTSQYFPG